MSAGCPQKQRVTRSRARTLDAKGRRVVGSFVEEADLERDEEDDEEALRPAEEGVEEGARCERSWYVATLSSSCREWKRSSRVERERGC